MSPTILAVPYDPLLVALSFVVSALGAYVALWVTAQAQRRGGITGGTLVSISLALGGVGIWSAHFLGMIAFRLPVVHGYAMAETALSLVAAVLVSGLAMGYLAKDPKSRSRLLTAGILAGAAVAVMHYLGMGGMRFQGYLAWNWPLVAASVGIAMLATTTALWLAFNTRGQAARIGASLLMGAAVCAMHYTGMAAADVCVTANKTQFWNSWTLRPSELPLVVPGLAVGVLLLIGVDTLLRRMQPAVAGQRA